MSDYSELTDEDIVLAIRETKGYEFQQNAPEGNFCLTVGNDKGWWKIPGYKEWTCAQCYDISPDWSTVIAEAWELFEEMPEWVTVMKTTGENKWYCGCHGSSDEQGNIYWYQAFADTAPRAICIAWLIWKDAQKEQP
jgi:hypothetical protein